MRKSIHNQALIAAAALALLWSNPAHAQEPLNKVGDGDFESGFIGLSLPAAAQFPLFSGAWASRGERVPEVSTDNPFEGAMSVRVSAGAADPLHIIQDLPADSSAYGMRFAFLIENGQQTVRLLEGWNRADPSSGTPTFEARISSGGIEFVTAAGRWRTAVVIEPDRWHTLTVIADPRVGTHDIRLDGTALISLPRSNALRPSTFIAGGTSASTFRYDAIEVMSLVDLELAAIRDNVARLDVPVGAAVLDRLAAAGLALARGSTALAVPELGVARNMLGNSALATEDLRRALTDLMDLIEVSSSEARELRRSSR